MNYTDQVPVYAKLMPVERWRRYIEAGMYNEWDGHGYPVKNGLMDSKRSCFGDLGDATHVAWINT